MDIDKPNGMVISFWLSAESIEKLDIILKGKNITEIEWIREEKPPWENNE